MTDVAGDPDFPLTGKFLLGRARQALSLHERDVLEKAVHAVETHPGGHVLLERGVMAERSTILIEGFMTRVIETGQDRSTVALQVSGDFVDLHAFALKRLDHDVVTLGTAKVAYIAHEMLERIMRDEPHLARLLWFSTLLDAAIHRNWILKLEQLTVEGRLAHLLAETWQRLAFVGEADADGFAIPITQIELADACGTPPIHLNRIIRKLREDGIVYLNRSYVSILDHAKLKERGAFSPGYLYGEGRLYLGDVLTTENS